MHNYLKVKKLITLTLATSALHKFHMIEAPRGGRACYQSNSFMTEVCITHHPYSVSYAFYTIPICISHFLLVLCMKLFFAYMN